MSAIQWSTRFSATEDRAIAEDKAILVDVYNPDSIACRQQEKATYLHKEVVDFIARHFAPFRVDFREEKVVENYYLTWSPALIFLDRQGRDVHRSTGYLGPEDFFATARLALGKIESYNGNHDGAHAHLKRVLADYPQSEFAAEALYYMGVNRFRENGNPEELGRSAARLQKEFPVSIWARKGSPYLLEIREAAPV